MPEVTISRRFDFSSSHRYYREEWSEEENTRVFGLCALPNGHGHNYGLTVTVAGPIDAPTGAVMPLDDLDAIVRRNVLDAYDHRYLNLDVEDYLDLVPTGENIARRVWERLEKPLGGLLRVADLFGSRIPLRRWVYLAEDERQVRSVQILANPIDQHAQVRAVLLACRREPGVALALHPQHRRKASIPRVRGPG